MSESVRTAPVAPAAPSADHPALRVLADVASYLEAGIGTEDVFQGIVGALGRNLGARDCRVWVRTADGASFRAIGPSGAPEPEPGLGDQVAGWVAAGESQESSDGVWHLRIPLVHEGEE